MRFGQGQPGSQGGGDQGGGQEDGSRVASEHTFLASRLSVRCMAAAAGHRRRLSGVPGYHASPYRVTVRGSYRGPACAGRLRLGFRVRGARTILRTSELL